MFVPGEDENEDADDWEPGPEVTRELYLEWRDARRGVFPGEFMTNPVWRWLIDSNISAYRGNGHFKRPSSYGGNPGSCFNRFGRSLTELTYDTKLIIGGEHEARVVERNRIILQGGKIDYGPDHGGYLENFDSWRLNLGDLSWERLTCKPVGRWEFVREDGEVCRLIPKRMARMTPLVGISGGQPDAAEFDGELFDRLYDPLVPHEALVDYRHLILSVSASRSQAFSSFAPLL